MAFDTVTAGETKLVLTPQAPGTIAKCSFEKLTVGERGRVDTLDIYYEGIVDTLDGVNEQIYDIGEDGTDMTLIASTPGTWYLDRTVLESSPEEIPFVRFRTRCYGIHTHPTASGKEDAVRWFGTTESQSGEDILYLGVVWPTLNAEILSVGVEIDTVLLGSAPDMTAVGTEVTPPNDPAVRASFWSFLVDPTYNHPNGWVLADIKPRQMCARSDFWEATYVYRYKYALSP